MTDPLVHSPCANLQNAPECLIKNISIDSNKNLPVKSVPSTHSDKNSSSSDSKIDNDELPNSIAIQPFFCLAYLQDVQHTSKNTLNILIST